MWSVAEINDELVRERLSTALRHASRNAPTVRYWIAVTADELDLNPDTFKSYFYGQSTPSLQVWFKIVRHLGRGFTNQFLEELDLTCFKKADAAVAEAEVVRAMRQVAIISQGYLDDADKQPGGNGKDEPGAAEEAGA